MTQPIPSNPLQTDEALQQQQKDKQEFEQELSQPAIAPGYTGSGKLRGRVALITGGDSGIGRSVAAYFAREGADIAIVYLESEEDAAITRELVTAENRQCLLIRGDLAGEDFCEDVVQRTYQHFGRIDILVNNAGTHEDSPEPEDVTAAQLRRTFEVNLFSMFYLSKAVLAHMEPGSAIINTASVTAYRGSDHLLDYSASKGAIVSFTRSLALSLASKGIRVNGVAPGPVWTPLVVASFDVEHLRKFGKDTPLGRAGYPYEVGPAYVYLASADSTYVTGQMMHVNGGDVING